MDVLKIGDYTFKPVGVDGVYICDCVVFKAEFDKNFCNDWEKSSGKKLLEKWFKRHAPAEIQEQFDIDLPTVKEVFSQEMLNLYHDGRKLTSRQFPIFKDLDERMKKFDGKRAWWWTRSTHAGYPNHAWSVNFDGVIYASYACSVGGFVPVLRKLKKRLMLPAVISK